MSPKSPKQIRLRRLRESDSALILLWRNDPVTRRNSFSVKKISAAEHQAWFEKAVRSKKQIFLLAAQKNRHPLGVLRYDPRGRSSAEININLNPKKRGKGWGACILRAGNEWVARAASLRKIIARIKPENEASKKAFQSAGFRFRKRVQAYEIYECRL